MNNEADATYPDPSPEMLKDWRFNAIWHAIKGWDMSRHNDGLYAGPTGNDVRHILDALTTTAEPGEGEAAKPEFRYRLPGGLWTKWHAGNVAPSIGDHFEIEFRPTPSQPQLADRNGLAERLRAIMPKVTKGDLSQEEGRVIAEAISALSQATATQDEAP